MYWSILPVQAQTIVLQKSEIKDLAGGSGFKAFSVLVPQGWQIQGGVHWNQPCTAYGYSLNWQAAAPDRSAAVAIMPAVTWGGLKMAGCPQFTFQNLSDVLVALVRRLDVNAQFTSYNARPDLLDRQLPELNLGLIKSSFVSDAGVLSFTMTDGYGQRVRGLLLGKMIHVRTQTVGANGVPSQQVSGGIVEPSFLYLTLPEQFDPRVAEIVRRSILVDRNWAKRMQAHHTKVDRERSVGGVDRLRFQSQFYRANSGLFSSFRDRDTNGDWLNRERAEAIRGVETYMDTDGSEVQVDNTYGYIWAIENGTYIATNDPGLDPNVGGVYRAQRLREAN